MWILLTILAVLALLAAQIPALATIGFGALPLAIVLGMLVGNTSGIPHGESARQPILFCQQKMLRLGVVLLGFNISGQQLLEAGWRVIALDLIVVILVLAGGIFIGIRWLRIPAGLAVLTSVGSAVCGASAIMAVEPVVKARERDVSLAVATVVVFGTLAMLSYPLIYQWSNATSADYGFYIGSTVHEVAQAVAAGQAIDTAALHNAMIAKLARVMLLAPVVFCLGFWWQKRHNTGAETSTQVQTPWFVIGFIATSGINSLLPIPELALQVIGIASQMALALAMVALGMKTHWKLIREGGAKPFALAASLWLLLLSGGFYLVPWVLAW